ncbi:MAG TPA: hypothetical protein VFN48_08470 [Solirubrobacteraceae bacterium]|nr:hypothetical protein [Solirubrobacteraceae bacterium]
MATLARTPNPRGGRLADMPLVSWGAEHPFAASWLAAVLLGILSGIVWPTIPSYDPFSWVVWGHAVTAPTIPFYVGSGPSWKPLPFFFTTIYGIFGSPAPWLWVVTARIGGIAGLIGAGRLCFILCRRAGLPAWAPWIASLAAIAGIVLSWNESLWTYYFFRGTSETFLIGIWLWAVERFFSGRHLQAFLLVAVEGLMRPEAWPFLLVYGVYLAWREPRLRVWIVVGIVAQPAGWFGPPWISTGQPFLAATHASLYNGQLGANPILTVIQRGESLQSLPSLVLAILAAGIGLVLGRAFLRDLATRWRRPTDLLARVAAEGSEVPLVLSLALFAVGWWIVVIVETADHYPGLQRFYLPAAAMICVLSGYGLVRVAAWIGALAGRVGGGRPATLVVGLLAAVAMSIGSWHWLSPRWTWAKAEEPLAALATHRIGELGVSIRAVGGIRRILPCASSVITINHSLQTAMAWELGTDLGKVQTVLVKPGLAWVGPRDSIDGGVPPIAFSFSARQVAKVGAWSIQQVYPRGGRPGPCVGS